MRIALLLFCLAVSMNCTTQIPAEKTPYSVFDYFGGRLQVFSLDSDTESKIALPFEVVGGLAFDPQGSTLYGRAARSFPGPEARGIYMIQFNPVRTTLLPGSEVFAVRSGVSVSRDKDQILFFGATNFGSIETVICGVFEFETSTQKLTRILDGDTCEQDSRWLQLSLSPDGSQAVGVHADKVMSVIDIARHTRMPVSGKYYGAAWSPDGKWIAAYEIDKKQIVLFDAATLRPVRMLGRTDLSLDLAFSPDSRYLLTATTPLWCLGYSVHSLAKVDIYTGRSKPIEGYGCRVNGRTGWIDNASIAGDHRAR